MNRVVKYGHRIFLLSILLLATFVVGAQDVTQTEPDLELGASIFADRCTRCHAPDGTGVASINGQPISPPNFTDAAAREGKTPADYYEQVTTGNLGAVMPPYGNILSDVERWSVANYVYNLPETRAVVEPAVATTEEAVMGSAPVTIESVPGTVSGQIIHGTADGILPEDMVVTLHIVDSTMNDTSIEASLDADGNFEFTDVPITANQFYFVSTQYGEGNFNSDFAMGDPTNPDRSFTITVYDATDDSSVVVMSQVLAQIDPLHGSMRIIELYSFSNTSDRLYITERESGQHVSVRVPIPEGASLVETSDETRFFIDEEDGMLYDTRPVLPNSEHNFYITYSVPYDEETIQITQSFDYPLMEAFQVFAPIDQATVEGGGWSQFGTQAFNETEYLITGIEQSFDANELISFTISDIIVPPPPEMPDDASTDAATGANSQLESATIGQVLLVIGVVLILIALALFFFTGRGGDNNAPVDGKGRMDALMREIAELDDQFEAKNITKAAYEQRRKVLKSELAQVMKTID